MKRRLPQLTPHQKHLPGVKPKYVVAAFKSVLGIRKSLQSVIKGAKAKHAEGKPPSIYASQKEGPARFSANLYYLSDNPHLSLGFRAFDLTPPKAHATDYTFTLRGTLKKAAWGKKHKNPAPLGLDAMAPHVTIKRALGVCLEFLELDSMPEDPTQSHTIDYSFAGRQFTLEIKGNSSGIYVEVLEDGEEVGGWIMREDRTVDFGEEVQDLPLCMALDAMGRHIVSKRIRVDVAELWD